MGPALVAAAVVVVLAVLTVVIVVAIVRVSSDDSPRRRERRRLQREHKISLETINQVEQLLDRYPGLDTVGQALVYDVREIIRNNRQRIVEENK